MVVGGENAAVRMAAEVAAQPARLARAGPAANPGAVGVEHDHVPAAEVAAVPAPAAMAGPAGDVAAPVEVAEVAARVRRLVLVVARHRQGLRLEPAPDSGRRSGGTCAAPRSGTGGPRGAARRGSAREDQLRGQHLAAVVAVPDPAAIEPPQRVAGDVARGGDHRHARPGPRSRGGAEPISEQQGRRPGGGWVPEAYSSFLKSFSAGALDLVLLLQRLPSSITASASSRELQPSTSTPCPRAACRPRRSG